MLDRIPQKGEWCTIAVSRRFRGEREKLSFAACPKLKVYLAGRRAW
jgi:hypothetical protein